MSNDLRQALERVASRFRQIRLWSALAACWVVWASVGAGLLLWSSGSGEAMSASKLFAGLVALAAITGTVCAFLALRSARDRRWIARRIEARHPDLGTGLLAAVEEDAAGAGRLGYLQATVVRKALEHGRSHDWDETVPSWKLRGMKLAHAAALAMLIVVSFNLAGQARSRRESDVALPTGTEKAGLTVEPGSAEIERGTALLIVATFTGAVPDEVSLVVEDGKESAAGRTMTRSLEDPTFAGRIESVESDLSYRIEYAGRRSETYRIKVFEFPEVVRTDAQLVFPSYTSLEPKTVEDVRHVTAVEGTELTLLFRLNKPVKTARLLDEQGGAFPLTADASGEHLYATKLTLAAPQRFRVELVDEEGRANKVATEIAVNVVRNRPAVVKMTRPARDVRVSPVEELSLAAKLEDDFGVVRHGMSYALAGSEPKEIVLAGSEPNARKLEAAQLLDFESFAAEPDQLVSYYFWAEDIRPDGESRRTSGDMFFAEVRPFEEIFRQGEQTAGGQQRQQAGQQGGGAAQQAMEFAELQKEIINGTWKLIRRETGRKPTSEFGPDVKLLEESQRSAIEQAAGLEERLQDPTSKQRLAEATGFMNDAATKFGEAAGAADASPLQPALVAAQSAYQALLKLRDREFNVVRGQQQQQGGGGGGGPSQQQLQQLELSNEENRYEERRSAQAEDQSEQAQQQRETQQVLNRLRELARRQEDLNERLKELQSALEAAKDEAAREELQRQLKRLRDQEQEILRDTDELRERMENEQNRERMADARQQVEESRERVRQASEALEEGRVSQALTEGTRAGRQLDELSEELRKETSNRFSEEMTEMRDEARRLDEIQDALSERLDAMDQTARRSLRDGDDRKEIRQGIEDQKEKLDQLLDRMRQTVQEAEESEPLLAEKLFDTVRQAEQRSIPDALNAADRLTDLGVGAEAAKASRDAAEGLGQLREGVDEAAESVLGDETEALRRAQGELEDLADQIDRELGRSPDQRPEAGNSAPPPSSGPEMFDDFQPPSLEGRAQSQQRSDAGAEGEQGPPQRGASRGEQSGEQGPSLGGQSPSDRAQDSSEERGSGPPESQGAEQRSQSGSGESPTRGDQDEAQRQPGEGGEQQPSGQDGSPGQGSQPGEQNGQPGQQGGQPGQQRGGQGGQPGQQSGAGEQQGQQAGGNRQGDRPSGGSLRDRAGGGERNGSPNGGARGTSLERLLEGSAGPSGPEGPITGEGFREWSDRLRDVEELLEDPDLRAEAARIRDRARGAREEFKRHSKEPDPKALAGLVADPLRELRDRVAEEIRRRESPDSLVPIDRDPVPPAYAEGVRRYYERLGAGR